MDYATVSQLVGTLGFPIVACGALFYMLNKNEASRREDNNRLSEAINNNTNVITKLVTKLGGDEK
jgi:preprotein translocase subunit YajC